MVAHRMTGHRTWCVCDLEVFLCLLWLSDCVASLRAGRLLREHLTHRNNVLPPPLPLHPSMARRQLYVCTNYLFCPASLYKGCRFLNVWCNILMKTISMWNFAWRVVYMCTCMFMSLCDSGGTCDSGVPLYLNEELIRMGLLWLKESSASQLYIYFSITRFAWEESLQCGGDGEQEQVDRWRKGKEMSWTCQRRHRRGRDRASLMVGSTKICSWSDDEETLGS